MYYYYVLKNWIISKYYNVFGSCVSITEEHREPLLNNTYDNKIKKNVYDDEFKNKFNDDNDDDDKLLI